MIPTCETLFNDVMLIVPLIGGYGPEFPYSDFHEYKGYCGPGQGLAEWIVPDYIYTVPVGVCCWIHDLTQEICESTEENFFQSNIMLRDNLTRMVDYFIQTNRNKHIAANNRVGVYYAFVQSDIGHYSFFRRRHA